MRLMRSVLARFWLVCVLGLVFPLSAHAQFVLEIRSPHPQIDPAMRSLAHACAGELDAAAAVSNSGDLNVALSNVAVAMTTGNTAGLEHELLESQRYAAAVGPGDWGTVTEAQICIRQAALKGGAAPARAASEPSGGGISMERFAGLWSGLSDCSSVIDLRPDGTWIVPGIPASWNIDGGDTLVLSTGLRVPLERVDDNTMRITGNASGFMFRCVATPGVGSGYARASTSDLTPITPPRPGVAATTAGPSPKDTAVARVRLAGLYGTRCVIPAIRNVRRPQEANPSPTSWIGDWVLANHCPNPQWVRIEVGGTGHLFWAGLQTPGARMQPSPAVVPSLSFRPVQENDFHFGWLVPGGAEIVTAVGDVVHDSVIVDGLDVWIASCDGGGDARRQAIYLSTGFRENPTVTCWNHALPNGGGDGS